MIFYPLAADEGNKVIGVANGSQQIIAVTLEGGGEPPTYPVTVSPGRVKSITAAFDPTRYTVVVRAPATGKRLAAIRIGESDKVGSTYCVVYPASGVEAVPR